MPVGIKIYPAKRDKTVKDGNEFKPGSHTKLVKVSSRFWRCVICKNVDLK